MDNIVLKKRLNTYRTAKGKLSRVSDEVIMEVLRAWESWPNTSKEFYMALGLSKQQLAILIKKGKKLVKSGIITDGEFSEIKVEEGVVREKISCNGTIELRWEKGNVIHFAEVDQLIDFLKKVS